MTWAKLDDSLHVHHKFMGLSLEAVGLWTMTLSWSARSLKDGKLPATLPQQFGASEAAVAELVAAELWDPLEGGGWVVHNYLQYNPSREQVLADRERGKERAAASKSRRKGARRYEASPEAPPVASPTASPPSRIPYPVVSSLTSDVVAETETSVPALKPPIATSPPPTASPAGRGSRMIHEATTVEWHPLSPKWRDALVALGSKPDSEWRVANEVLRREALKPNVAKSVLNPNHILAYWPTYSSGQSPGAHPPLKLQPEPPPSRYRDLSRAASGGG